HVVVDYAVEGGGARAVDGERVAIEIHVAAGERAGVGDDGGGAVQVKHADGVRAALVAERSLNSRSCTGERNHLARNVSHVLQPQLAAAVHPHALADRAVAAAERIVRGGDDPARVDGEQAGEIARV